MMNGIRKVKWHIILCHYKKKNNQEDSSGEIVQQEICMFCTGLTGFDHWIKYDLVQPRVIPEHRTKRKP